MDAYKKDGGDDTDLRRVNSDASSSSSSDDWYVGRVDEDTNRTCVQVINTRKTTFILKFTLLFFIKFNYY